MKKISRRSVSLLLIAAIVIGGLGYYVYLFVTKGADWALYFSAVNSDSSGDIFDRYGITLASFDSSGSSYNPDISTRVANYHVTGDYWGRTGTGLLSAFWSSTRDYSILTGTTKPESHSLWLNIDSQLNNVAFRAINETGMGTMLICNYRTGELLCMVSAPSVDPLDNDAAPPDGAYINRALSASFVPGSIFKLVTAAAAIETVPNIFDRVFFCDGEYDIAGVTIKCSGVHGNQDFRQAMANSCNVAFAQIAVKVGQPNMLEYVTKFGLNSRQYLDGISSVAGSYPEEFVGDPELGWSGIGQSVDMVCPYAMLRYICAIANGGTVIEPMMVRSEEKTETQLLNETTAASLQKLMRNNVIEHYGQENFPGLNICAKTGTAELGDGTSHSWFVGYIDDEEHPYAFVTMVERGGSGLAVAGNITNRVMQTICSNKNSEEQQ